MADVAEAKSLIAELCGSYYTQGWVSGTGGGMSIKAGDKLVMAPSGVPKERMAAADMFVLDVEGNILEAPQARQPPYKAPKLSECAPLFLAAYQLRGAGAVLHSHSINAVLATVLDPHASEFTVTHLEMIKGIAGHGFYDNCTIPIIENTARECELTGRLQEAIARYPRSNAVLVRRHGVYVWGDTWLQAKAQAECYDYVFEAAVRLRQLGIDASRAPAPPPPTTANGTSPANGHAEPAAKKQKVAAAGGGSLPKAIVLDIEGTVAPISFVTETLFPYAAQRLRSHLETTFDSEDTQHDIQLLRELGDADSAACRTNWVSIPSGSGARDAIIEACIASVEAQMGEDRKTTALKSLQGHIWHEGFVSGALKAQLFGDVASALVSWQSLGIKTYIYSSGSRGAQRDLFGHTTAGDLRPYLSGFFDTTSGSKVEASSYKEIALSLGTDSPSDILFATDNILEAQAAAQAGWKAVLTVREGNKPLPTEHNFRVITDMQELID